MATLPRAISSTSLPWKFSISCYKPQDIATAETGHVWVKYLELYICDDIKTHLQFLAVLVDHADVRHPSWRTDTPQCGAERQKRMTRVLTLPERRLCKSFHDPAKGLKDRYAMTSRLTSVYPGLAPSNMTSQGPIL